MIRDKIKDIPHKSGVYLFKDNKNKIIYIGKAKDLKKRVSSYFSLDLDYFKQFLVKKIYDLEYIITDSEKSAFILENILIKKYKPYYNIRLKDDKNYPYIRINLKESFPYFEYTRYINDNSLYFGPFSKSKDLQIIDFILKDLFKIRSCKGKLPKKVCIYYQMNKCLAPCINKDIKDLYNKNVQLAINFLKGEDFENLYFLLNEKMQDFSKKQLYEIAIIYREAIKFLDKFLDKDSEFKEIISIAYIDKLAVINVISLKQDYVFSSSYFNMHISNTLNKFYSLSDILYSFFKQYYSLNIFKPSLILTDILLNTKQIQDLKQNLNLNIEIILDFNNKFFNFVSLAKNNALFKLKEYIFKKDRKKNVLYELFFTLRLKKIPARIEGYDVSVFKKNIYVSCVVFKGDKPLKKDYRVFKIDKITYTDDYLSLKIALKRRILYILKEKDDSSLSKVPDLIVIDGGKGQLNVALKVFKRFLDKIDIISIAKSKEIIYKYENGKIIEFNLKRDSKVLHLIQYVRDESHRFSKKFTMNKYNKLL